MPGNRRRADIQERIYRGKLDTPKTQKSIRTVALSDIVGVRGGPEFITKGAALLDWPSNPGGEYRVLRKGANEWTCLPGFPLEAHDEPACFDRVFLQWMQDSRAGRTPHIDRVGISYMYMGAIRQFHPGGHEFHVSPHLMIVSPHQEELEHFNRDGSNGMPYVTHLPKRPELFLVIPVRQWDKR